MWDYYVSNYHWLTNYSFLTHIQAQMGLSPSDHNRNWKSWGSFALPRPPPLKNTQKTSLCILLGSPASAEPSCLNNTHVFRSPDKDIQKQIARERGTRRGKAHAHCQNIKVSEKIYTRILYDLPFNDLRFINCFLLAQPGRQFIYCNMIGKE